MKNFLHNPPKLEIDNRDIACEEFVNLMQAIIDGEATKEEEEFFNQHYSTCNPCHEYFTFSKSFFEFVKSKIKVEPLPNDLASSILQKVKELDEQ